MYIIIIKGIYFLGEKYGQTITYTLSKCILSCHMEIDLNGFIKTTNILNFLKGYKNVKSDYRSLKVAEKREKYRTGI